MIPAPEFLEGDGETNRNEPKCVAGSDRLPSTFRGRHFGVRGNYLPLLGLPAGLAAGLAAGAGFDLPDLDGFLSPMGNVS